MFTRPGRSPSGTATPSGSVAAAIQVTPAPGSVPPAANWLDGAESRVPFHVPVGTPVVVADNAVFA